MRVVFADINTSFYDRHWVFALTSTLRKLALNDMQYVSVSPTPRSAQKIARLEPDLVLYTAFSHNVSDVINFDAMIKSARKCRSVLGGPGPTFAEIDIQKTTLDAICIGEGELAIQDYLESGMTSGRNLITLKDPTFKPAPLVDVDQEPMPDRSIIYRDDRLLAQIPAKAFMTGRGCPYSCTYCFNHAFNTTFGLKIRKRSVENVIAEIELVKARYGLNFISFQDDTFCIDKKWLAAFADIYPRKIGIPFACNVRANLVNDDIARLLRAAGVHTVSWSIESGNDQIRNDVLKRRMSKEQMQDAAAALRKHNIPYRIANVIGIPGETREQVCETVDYNLEIRSSYTIANIFTPYPKLELTQRAIALGLLNPDFHNQHKTFYQGSCLGITSEFNEFLIKTSCLMPFFVWFPRLWKDPKWRSFLYRMPTKCLRAVYEVTYLFACKTVYGLRVPLKVSLTMAWRYLRSF